MVYFSEPFKIYDIALFADALQLKQDSHLLREKAQMLRRDSYLLRQRSQVLSKRLISTPDFLAIAGNQEWK
ncbi:MAG: hypothetical protein JOZ18_00105 [Chloroflexi bacterium]|nr:hypothetical protein [Chloroflexota bacterium]